MERKRREVCWDFFIAPLKKWGRGGEGGEERDGFSMFWW
jgi:hypothetical protein